MKHRPLRPVVLLSGLATGGAERVTVSFVRRLRAMGIRAVVWTVTARHDGPLAAELSDAGVPRHDLGARRLADPRGLWRLGHLLAHERPDVVHAHGQDAAILAATARQFHPFPLAITRHVMDEPTTSLPLRLRAAGACVAFRRADAAVAVSDAAARRLADLSGLPHRSIHVIPNGIEMESFDHSTEDRRSEVRAALSAGPGEQLVLVPAVLREGKGHDVLLRALPAVRARVPAARLLVAGGGEREAALRSQTRALGDEMAAAVRFLGPRTDIPDLLAACDLVVLPSAGEALPTALIEAAAAGRPVVATRVGGTPEVVVDGVSGLLVPPRNPAALADAIAILLLDRARARLYGTAARGIARSRFSIDTQIGRTLELWDALQSEQRGGGAARSIAGRVSSWIKRNV
jgi:glycosyltransferase involved in cell wall biosynthesis